MFSLATYKITKEKRRHWLSIWPLSATDFQAFIRSSHVARGKSVYVNIAHKAWRETRHLPRGEDIGARPLGNGAVGVLSGHARFWHDPVSMDYADIQLYIPDKPIENEEEVALICDSSLSGEYHRVLQRWGGYGLFLHDSCKFHLDYLPSCRAMPEKFAYLLPGVRRERTLPCGAGARALWRMLYLLAADKCAVIAWDEQEGFLFRQADESIIRYEETASLFPPRKWRSLRGSVSRRLLKPPARPPARVTPTL